MTHLKFLDCHDDYIGQFAQRTVVENNTYIEQESRALSEMTRLFSRP